jgi:hypothetical protein
MLAVREFTWTGIIAKTTWGMNKRAMTAVRGKHRKEMNLN